MQKKRINILDKKLGQLCREEVKRERAMLKSQGRTYQDVADDFARIAKEMAENGFKDVFGD